MISEAFSGFASQCGSSPLYALLARCISQDAEVLELATKTVEGQPPPNLLLGAVHYLLLGGADHPLRAYYPSCGGEAREEGLYASFRDFCFGHHPQIERLVRARRVQTNEVGRTACLSRAFVATGARRLALVEVGTSAGLNLNGDRYEGITCESRGGKLPPDGPWPEITARVGIDRRPVDLNDPDEVLWLRALVWPDQPYRMARLENAIAITKRDPPRLVEGDALTSLEHVVEELPRAAPVCVFHSSTLSQFSVEGREQFGAIIRRMRENRDLFYVSMEWLGTPTAELRLNEALLARCDAHGGWIEWV